MSRFLILLGFMIILLGIFYPVVEKMGLGKLPGDFYIEKGNLKFYFPILSSILVSCVISVILWLVGKY